METEVSQSLEKYRTQIINTKLACVYVLGFLFLIRTPSKLHSDVGNESIYSKMLG